MRTKPYSRVAEKELPFVTPRHRRMAPRPIDLPVTRKQSIS